MIAAPGPRSRICPSCGMPWLPAADAAAGERAAARPEEGSPSAAGAAMGELCARCRGSEGGLKGRDEVQARLARWLVQAQDLDPEAARALAGALLDRQPAWRAR